MEILQLMKKIGVIFNKSAGSFQKLNRDPKEWIDEITARNSIRNVEFDVRIIPAPEINDTIKYFVDNKYDVITASGGDGTINGVATIIKDSDAALGVIPIGTFNHFAKDVEYPWILKRLCLILLMGKQLTLIMALLTIKFF